LQLLLLDVECNEAEKIKLAAGQRVTIYPMYAHKFIAIAHTQIIEYYPTAFDLNDEWSFNDFDGD